MKIALTHAVSPNIDQCELSFLDRQSINPEKATKQHAEYCRLFRDHGLKVIELSVNRSYPDSTFIEDTAVVVDEIAVMARMGVTSRRGEVASIEPELAKYRKTVHLPPTATLEGGDVLRVQKRIFVGISPRTNSAGAESLRAILEPFGYEIIPVILNDCLHLKSACTAVDDHSLLINPRWLDLKPLRDFKIVSVPEDEPWAANTLRINNTVLLHAAFHKTADLLRNMGLSVETLDISELLKAEAGMTCSSIIFEYPV